jgi:hypothetical protein
LAGGVVPGTQPPVVVEGAQFIVPSGAGVMDGVVELAGVVVSAPGVGGVVEGVTTPGVVGAVLGVPAGVAGGGAVVLPVPDTCAPAAMAESIVHATAKHAIAKKAPV